MFASKAVLVTITYMNLKFNRIQSFLPDSFVQLLIGTIILASFFPVYGNNANIANIIVQIAIFSLFFLNGVRLPRKEVLEGVKNWRLQGSIFFWVFAIMPIVGWVLSILGAGVLPENLIIGILFLGVLPSTVQSAVAYNSLAGGNVTASVIASALLNLTGIFVTPMLFAGLASASGVVISLESFWKICLILLLPFFLGQIMQAYLMNWVIKRKKIIIYMDRGAIAIAVYVAFSGAVVAGIWTRTSLYEFGLLLIILILFLSFAFIGSWLAGGLLKFNRYDRKAFLFAGAHKSLAIGAPMAAILFPPEKAGMILLPILLYHLVQLIISAPVANILSKN